MGQRGNEEYRLKIDLITEYFADTNTYSNAFILFTKTYTYTYTHNVVYKQYSVLLVWHQVIKKVMENWKIKTKPISSRRERNKRTAFVMGMPLNNIKPHSDTCQFYG